MVTALLEFREAGFAYNGTRVLEGATAALSPGELVAIVGPNGAGKSTLLSVCAGLQPSYEGSCLYAGREVRDWNRREFAREVAFVPQSLRMEFPFTCEQVVMMGRAPFGDGLFESEEDFREAERAMELTDCAAFRNRDFRALSGGERQRVVLASAIAQRPRVLLLDEPTTFLDLKHQLLIYGLLRDLRKQGLLVVTVTHDLNLALSFAGRVLMLQGGRQRACGAVEEVLTPAAIRDVFEVECAMIPQPGGGQWIAYAR
ncbi:MAG: Hemin import ATP-binding protein HmuV [Bryobacteraceae bacterium]|nr:Hemin import ATP-binding protein HmuV [Bryobacteraceae bacterium]